MLGFDELKKKYSAPGELVVTAHRGLSGKYPENTMEAFEAAMAIGADFVEFDTHCTKDGVPVVIHDLTVDRSTDGHGNVKDYSLAALKQLNASYWDGPHDTGQRLIAPARSIAPVPALEEVFARLAGKVFLNIQVYEESSVGLTAICGLYQKFNLYKSAFLMVGTFAVAETVKAFDPKIEICVGEDRVNLERHKAFGSTFVQPWHGRVTPEFCQRIKHLELCANMFFANTAEDCRKYRAHGIQGMLSDRSDIIIEEVRGR